MDFEQLASDVLRAQRGRRSQLAWSRWLGFNSNVAYAWESGRAYPTAASTLAVFARQGVNLHEVFVRFYQGEPRWLRAVDPASPAAVASLLDDLRGRMTLHDLAERCEASRFAVARWLSGQTAVRLPDFLRALQAASLRALDFVALLVDPLRLPSAAANWRRLESSRKAAYDMPWTQAVLRGLELAEYKARTKHQRGWLARRLGISAETESACLELLLASGQIRLHAGRYEPVEVLTLDTRRDPEKAWQAREFWARAGLERLTARHDGLYWYNVFGISERDLARVRELQARHFRELRSIIAQSEPVERVVLSVQQLIPLDGAGKPPRAAPADRQQATGTSSAETLGRTRLSPRTRAAR